EPVRVSSFDALGLYYQPAWQRKELSKEKEGLHQPATILVLGEETAFSESIVTSLTQSGNRVFFKEQLGTIPKETMAVYLLQGLRGFDHKVGVEDRMDLQEYAVFQCIKQLLAAHLTNLGLTVLTYGTQAVHAEEQVQAAGSGLVGLVGSLAQEQPNWKVRMVDLDLLDADTVSMVLRVPFSKAGEVQVLRSGSLLERHLVPIAKDASLPTNGTLLRPSGVYVILGGAGGLGRVTTEYLVKHYQAQVYWLGRRKQDAEIDHAIADISTYGPSPVYLSCDATDRLSVASAYQQIKLKEKEVHGLFHSAIVLHDQALVNMDEEGFHKAFDVKSSSSHYLVECFREEALDFICFYSSMQSYMTAPGQSNYAAGCTYQDSYAREVEQEWGIPCYTMHWGYWGEVGVVASSAYRARMSELGIGSIGATEGMEALELLLGGEERALSMLQLTDGKVTTRFPWLSLSRRWVYQGERSALVPETIAAPSWEDDEAVQALEALCYRGILQVLVLVGLEEGTPESLLDRLGMLDKYRRLFSELVRSLKAAHYLEEKEGILSIPEVIRKDLSSFALRDAIKSLVAHYPDYQAHGSLLQVCLESFKEIVQGAKSATDVLFPEGSIDLVSGIYQGHPQADHYNQVLCAWVRATIAQSLSRLKEGERFTILEVGAGTGGTSALLFAVLKEHKNQLRYLYTDVSKRFLLYAEEHYKSEAPYLETKIFDIEASPESQGLALGSCDLVIGANVVHATKDIATSLEHLKGVLKKDGLLVLNELGRTEMFTTLTFGLLDGWWRYEDEELRLAGSPGLSRERWGEVLSRTGYQALATYPDGGHAPAQQLILAQSDGRVVLRNTIPPQSAASEKRKPALLPSGTTPGIILTLEQQLVEIASACIHLPQAELDVEENFSDYGFDSILGNQLVKNINDALGISLNPTDIFNYPNIASLAEYISQNHALADLPEETAGLSVQGKHAVQQPGRIDVHESMRRKRKPRGVVPHQEVLEREEERGKMDIAIVGMSGAYGSAGNLEVWWEALRSGRSLIGEVPQDRWAVADHYSEEKGAPGKTYSKWGSFLEGIAEFDPLFFRISGREAEHMDPQQRVFLQHCWHALEDAGMTAKDLAGKRCGVYVGAAKGDYLQQQTEVEDASAFWGNSSSILASRISYYLNLKGPALAVDTACSSSLVAMELACKSLRQGDTEVAISGGVTLNTTPSFYKLASSAGMLSADGQCYTFDARANGFVPGEGVGVLLLKRLEDAEGAGDRIYGVVKGIGTNQDGTTNGITAPSSASQEHLERGIYEKYELHPESISYVEAHGTGTALGDPIEFEALTSAFRSQTDKVQYCGLGSAKTVIGHTLMAAGVAGVQKVLLSMKDGVLPPSLNYREANPLLDLENSPFYINAELKEWQAGNDQPRRAAVSSFGFSGTNAHVVIEEYREAAKIKNEALALYGPFIVPLSAKNEERLEEMVQNLARYLDDPMKTKHLNLSDLAYTLQVGREAMDARMAMVVNELEELKAQLADYQNGDRKDLLIGEVKKDQSDFLLEGAAVEACLQTAISKRQIKALAQLWIKGIAIDWNLLYAEGQKPHKIRLPTYPFA
ncbi:MAG: SDR family NAD(P)-dependent oxidoreductase, partial [Verrucomicrobiota bacterium]